MYRTRLSLVAVICTAITVPVPVLAASTGVTRNAAFSSIAGATLPATPTVLLTAGLRKGKPRRALEVVSTVSASFVTSPGVALSTDLSVNGVSLEPAGSLIPGTTCSIAVIGSCAMTVMGWLDLDAHPELWGVPLTVILQVVDPTGAGVGAPIDATLSVKLVKK